MQFKTTQIIGAARDHGNLDVPRTNYRGLSETEEQLQESGCRRHRQVH